LISFKGPSYSDANFPGCDSTLININRGGEKGCQDAAEHAKAAGLKSFFRQQAGERARFARQLETEMAQLGEPTTEKGSGHVTAALHRGWIEVKQSLGGGDPSLLESVEQGEHAARESYQKALQAALPESILMIVGERSGAILAAHDQVKALRDRRAAY
jgi:uncharacterized protein (TIGR02284 family)